MSRLVVVAVACAACGAALPPLPSQGGPPWIEITSPHFVVWTDAGANQGRAIITELEHVHDIVVAIAFPGAAASGKALVVAFRDPDELHAFVPVEVAGAALPPQDSELDRPMMLLSAESLLGDQVVIHELAHVVSFGVIREQPFWFAEGMATFFQTMRIDEHAGTVEIGGPLTFRGKPVRLRRMMSLRKMAACESHACTDGVFYGSALLFYTYLANVEPRRLARFEELLAKQPWKQAFAEAFEGTSLDDFDLRVRDWLIDGRHTIVQYRVSFPDFEIRQRPLGDGDAIAIRSLFQIKSDDARAVERTFEALRHAEPHSWRSWLLFSMVATGQLQHAALARGCGLARGDPERPASCARAR